MRSDERQQAAPLKDSNSAGTFSSRLRTHYAKFKRVATVAFCLYHIAAVLAYNLPATSPFHNELREPFTSYVLYNGLWQYWAMFETIPRHHAVHPRLVARYEDGSLKTFGPMMPGLRRYRHSTRISSLFVRYTNPENEFAAHVRLYLDAACKAVTEKTGRKPKQMALRLDTQSLLALPVIRAKGRMAERLETYGQTVADCR